MIIFFWLIILFSGLEVIFEALWDAEAFKEGDSNHWFKVFQLVSIGILFVIGSFSVQVRPIIWVTVYNLIFYIFVYLGVRFSIFSWFLNYIRNKPEGYKVMKNYNIIRIFVMIGTIGLSYPFYILNPI